MQFEIDKCAMLLTKKVKKVKPDGIQLPSDKVITSLEKGESYKYLGVLEAHELMVNEMKDKVKKEYYGRVRKVLETKLNSGNVFKAINNLGSISGEVLYSILTVVKTSTRGD